MLDPAADKGSPITLVDYEDATHDFDDPGRKRRREPGNQDAREDVLRRGRDFREMIFGK
ncbi:MAG: hypothetical protein KGK01_16345 [Bradyrhizobium sp.]|uniref:hypothetical protein n=1 Tax=Bradyrhizobium sp. TaxID=376 RepID=UPI001C282708|nr:hypothetical protein [Bradyrhizobium sp.]MBU6464459.1 hypothetical protein [Pseudomonadota bacterium]MDE2069337.1 hypothetical protein [Bradyrhizobium sp.]MDE2243936.1 hypothetical protein [Bradyrhizobium sp.]MDE2467687.1 hypothetical protein [Bradyrhizobium sp.]